VPIARYITVQDAVEQLGVVERTIRRWIEKGKIHAIRDPSGFVRLDLAEIEHIIQVKAATTPFLHQQMEALLQRVEALESDKEALAQQYTDLQRQMETLLQLLAQNQATDGTAQPFSLTDFLRAHMPLRRQTGNTQEPLERRGLLPGTMRLVNFAQLHQIKLWDLKQLHWAGTITLEIYQRDAEAKRNKQEWWITPEQHVALASYWHEHELPFIACPVCEAAREAIEINEA